MFFQHVYIHIIVEKNEHVFSVPGSPSPVVSDPRPEGERSSPYRRCHGPQEQHPDVHDPATVVSQSPQRAVDAVQVIRLHDLHQSRQPQEPDPRAQGDVSLRF